MITSLYIKNIAVIKELNIDFSNGFSVLTGETGAGKSIIMDCIGILLGSRSIKGKIRSDESEAVIRACFEELPDFVCQRLAELGFEAEEGIILQRNFNIEGKSQVKLNGQTVTQGIAKEIGAQLITIHGQNDNQKLMQKSEHLNILDSYACLDKQKNEYREIYLEYKALKDKLDDLRDKAKEKARLFDIYQFQAKEIDDLNLKAGEEEKLLAEEKRLQNLEKIQKLSKFTYHVLHGSEKSVSSLIGKASASLSQLEGLIPEAEGLNEKLIQLQYEIDDIADTAEAWGMDDGEDADKKLDKIGSRLNAIAKLKKKYGNTVEEIVEFRRKLGFTLDEMENSDFLIENCEKDLKKISSQLIEKASLLTESRKASAKILQEQIMHELEFLEMPKVRFVIDIKSTDEPTPNGSDEIEFLVATNAGQEPMPMIKIASGGELSRIMLAIKSILLDKDGATSVVFDEIDTGISGKTSRKVGIKLKHISKFIQVICVTHSAQIASLADNHYLISKHEISGTTQTAIERLDEGSKIAEVARILGSINITDNQFIVAKELIDEGKNL
ncbi:MAG: DNA repair protein RecN [Eubacteriales bacterium]